MRTLSAILALAAASNRGLAQEDKPPDLVPLLTKSLRDVGIPPETARITPPDRPTADEEWRLWSFFVEMRSSKQVPLGEKQVADWLERVERANPACRTSEIFLEYDGGAVQRTMVSVALCTFQGEGEPASPPSSACDAWLAIRTLTGQVREKGAAAPREHIGNVPFRLDIAGLRVVTFPGSNFVWLSGKAGSVEQVLLCRNALRESPLLQDLMIHSISGYDDHVSFTLRLPVQRSEPNAEAFDPARYASRLVHDTDDRKHYRIDPKESEWIRANWERILQDDVHFAIAEYGLEITEIAEGSILLHRGFRAKDRLIGVNGVRIRSLEDLVRLPTSATIKDAKTVTVEISRAGRPVYLTYAPGR